MTRESSTNPRFEDNGDIGPCDTADVTSPQPNCKMSCVDSAGSTTTLLQSNSASSDVSSVGNPPRPAEGNSLAKVLVPTTSRTGSPAPPPTCIITGTCYNAKACEENQPKSSLLLPECHSAALCARVQPNRSSYESIPADRCASVSQSHFFETNGKQVGGRVGPFASADLAGQTAYHVASSNCIDDLCLRQGCVLPNSGGHCSNAEKPLVDADSDNVAAATIKDPEMTMTAIKLSEEPKDPHDIDDVKENGTTKTGMDHLSHNHLEKNVFSPPTVIYSSKTFSSQSFEHGKTGTDEANDDLSSAASEATNCSPATIVTGSGNLDAIGVNATPSHLSSNSFADTAAEVENSAQQLGTVTSQTYTVAASDAEQKKEHYLRSNANPSSSCRRSDATKNDYLSTQNLLFGADELATSDDDKSISIPPKPHSSLLERSAVANYDDNEKKSNKTEISKEIFGDENMSCIKSKPDDNGAKHSLSKQPIDCQTQSNIKRGSGWGTSLGLGLRGGGEPSLANGATGWGPPPAARGGTGGWGTAPPQPNPTAAAAWGSAAPNSSASAVGSNDEPSVANNSSSVGKAPGSVSPPSSTNTVPVQPPQQTSTSWAAAAGKGLPTTNNDTNTTNASSNSTSKHALESLQSVREALFSQDGWGGNNVKQDNAWDISGSDSGNGPNSSKKEAGAAGGNGGIAAHKNDGTELWKANLAGTQLPAPSKPQPNNPWGGHTPQNPTDFRNWGEEDGDSQHAGPAPVGSGHNNGAQVMPGAGFGGGSANFSGQNSSAGPVNPPRGDNWNDSNGPNNYYGGPPKQDKPDWGGNPVGSGWGSDPRGPRDSVREPDMNHPRGSGGWGGNGPPHRPQPGGSGWNPGPPPPRGGGWDNESPTPSRRFDDGTQIWGNRDKGTQGPPGVTSSQWKEMPTPPSMGGGLPRGPPGPPRLPGKDMWGVSGNTRSWASDGNDSQTIGGPGGLGGGGGGWGDVDIKRDMPSWGSNERWGRLGGQQMPRISPGWGEDAGDPTWGQHKPPVGSKKMITGEMIWNSKPFRILTDMGCSKTDAENALRTTSMNLEDALELLNTHNRMPNVRNDGGPPTNSLFPPGSNNPYERFRGPGSSSGGIPFPPQDPPMGISPGFNLKMPGPNNGMNPPHGGGMNHGTGPRQGGGGSSGNRQPSADQLKLLVQQIQMAVQAGHLNPQILNQPLAPTTLVLLNQLLQQIKNLQSHQHTLSNHKNMGNNNSLTNIINVDIAKTKQEIQNLQNQISAQQANYLKTQTMPAPMHPPGGLNSGLPDPLVSMSQPPMPSVSSETSGSRLNQWINKLPDSGIAPGPPGGNFVSKAPGAGMKPPSTQSSNLQNDDTWSPNSGAGISGWPDSKSGDVSGTNGAIDFGIPEFEPGKPWKGPGMKNPDEDPNLTPGSVMSTIGDLSALSKTGSTNSLAPISPAISTSATGVDSLGLNPTWSTFGGGKSDPASAVTNSSSVVKDTWSNGPITSTTTSSLTPMGQDLWGKSAVGRTPPGLSGNGSGSAWPSNGWSTNGSSDTGTGWLLLKNLTTQIDGSTLKTLCMQHSQNGPLKNFQLFLNQGFALVHYPSSREAMKAQKALSGCVLNNTTIQAQIATDQEAENVLQQMSRGQQNQQPSSSSSRGGTPSASSASAQKAVTSVADMWGSTGVSVANSLYGVNTTTSSAGSTNWGIHSENLIGGEQRTTPQLQPYLPNDLLGENNL